MRPIFLGLVAVLISGFLLLAVFSRPTEISVGSKKFTESVILGNMLEQLARDAGYSSLHRAELGGTRLLWDALRAGQIDAYVEYTGTLTHEIYANKHLNSESEITAALKKDGIQMSQPLGFNDTYALGMKRQMAEKLGIKTISDLRRHPQLVFGLTQEFIARSDGWPALKTAYEFFNVKLQGLDHDFAYRAIASGDIQVLDLYSTDAEIKYYDLLTLTDDKKIFPPYNAVVLYRAELIRTAPKFLQAIQSLTGKIGEPAMIAMNAAAKLDRIPEASVAGAFLAKTLKMANNADTHSIANRILRHLLEHLNLVSRSLIAAILFSIPLGILAAKFPKVGHLILAVVSIIQTIPALALLVILIRPLNFFGLQGIGDTPAIVALFLYSLLPIVRNTHSGLTQMPAHITEAANALGLPAWSKLLRIELPIASSTIMAGIKTAAVINVGFATLGALVGAGGFGQPILTGIRLDDYSLILQGAIPAAVLALAVQALFSIAERILVPRGLKL